MNKPDEMSTYSRKLQYVQGRDEFIRRYPEIAYAAKKKFETDHPEESSGNAHIGVDHVIFFEAFSKYPMELEGGVLIQRKYWAKAFMEFDFKKSTEILCKGIFTRDELLLKNSQGAEKLSYVKKLAIVRAVEWMKNKNQDPWTYKPCAFPSEDDMEIMQGVFQNLNEVYPPTPTAETKKQMLQRVNEVDVGDFNYTDMFFKVVDLGAFGSAAMTVRDLTLVAIPYNDDVFVDGVQFSNGRWYKAYRCTDVVKMANILFRKVLKVDEPFYNLEDICPIKKLAIIRAVAWMKQKNWDEVFSFDPSISEHNRFLSPEEIWKIDDKLSEYLLPPADSSSLAMQIEEVGQSIRNIGIED